MLHPNTLDWPSMGHLCGWHCPSLSHQSWKYLFSQHYWAICAAVGDGKTKILRAILDIIGKRANPRQLARYSIARYVIKAYDSEETPTGAKLVQLVYINDKCPGRTKFFNTSRLKIGRQDLPKCLELMNLTSDCVGEFSDGYLRTKLKEQFFTF